MLAGLDRTTSRTKFRRYFILEEAWAVRWLLETMGHWHADLPADRAPLGRDPNDDYLVRLYWSARADWIVSGDQDVAEYAETLDIAVMSPRQAAEDLAHRVG